MSSQQQPVGIVIVNRVGSIVTLAGDRLHRHLSQFRWAELDRARNLWVVPALNLDQVERVLTAAGFIVIDGCEAMTSSSLPSPTPTPTPTPGRGSRGPMPLPECFECGQPYAVGEYKPMCIHCGAHPLRLHTWNPYTHAYSSDGGIRRPDANPEHVRKMRAIISANLARAVQNIDARTKIVRDLLTDDETTAARSGIDIDLRVECPWCGAEVGRPCTMPLIGGGTKQVKPHPSRVDLVTQ